MRKIRYQVCSQQEVYISSIDASKIEIIETKDTYEEAETFAMNLPDRSFLRTYSYSNIFIRKVYEL